MKERTTKAVRCILIFFLTGIGGLAHADTILDVNGTINPTLFSFDADTYYLGNTLSGTYEASLNYLNPEDFTPGSQGMFFAHSDDILAIANSGTIAFEAIPGVDTFASVAGLNLGLPVDYHLTVTMVPETEIWAMLIAGLGLLGYRLRAGGILAQRRSPNMRLLPS